MGLQNTLACNGSPLPFWQLWTNFETFSAQFWQLNCYIARNLHSKLAFLNPNHCCWPLFVVANAAVVGCSCRRRIFKLKPNNARQQQTDSPASQQKVQMLHCCSFVVQFALWCFRADYETCCKQHSASQPSIHSSSFSSIRMKSISLSRWHIVLLAVNVLPIDSYNART